MKKTTPKSKQYDIPVEGSLGLLALGAVGVREWRKVRDKAQKKAGSNAEKTKTDKPMN